MNDASWLIGIVNYYTKDLLFHQMRQLRRSSLRRKLRLLIVDNSNVSEADDLNKMIDQLGLADIASVIDNSHSNLTGSAAHAEGLNIVLAAKQSEDWMLTQDPDFFWLVPDHISFLDGLLRRGDLIAAGGPYRRKVGGGRADFPSAWGAVYALGMLEAGDFSAHGGGDLDKRYPFPEYDASGDVGWLIRNRLSDRNFVAFDQRPAEELGLVLGNHSFETRPIEYFYKEELVALHLFRGSFPLAAAEHFANVAAGRPPVASNAEWNEVKIRFARTAELISRSKAVRWAYRRYCRAVWALGRMPRQDDYDSYSFMQRMVLPYERQGRHLASLKARLKTDCVAHLTHCIDVVKNSEDAQRSFRQIVDYRAFDEFVRNLFGICKDAYGKQPDEGEVLRVAKNLRTSDDQPYRCCDDFLTSVLDFANSRQWDEDFDSAYSRYHGVSETMKLLCHASHNRLAVPATALPSPV